MLRPLAVLVLGTMPLRAQAQVASGDAAFFSALRGIPAALGSGAPQGAQVPAFKAKAEDYAHLKVSELLKGSGVPQDFIDKAFADPRVRIEEKIPEHIRRPKEKLPYEEYRKIFLTEERIQKGAEFYARNRGLLEAAQARYGVDPFVPLAIVGVETFYGRGTGTFYVFNSLYTQIHKVEERSEWAAKELAAWLTMTHGSSLDPNGIKGSYSGAFGFFQFIPSSFLKYAVDFDGDGGRDPYAWPDVLGSVANYMKAYGYDPSSQDFSKGSKNWNAIYAYNHSDNYVQVVIELRSLVRARVPPGS